MPSRADNYMKVQTLYVAWLELSDRTGCVRCRQEKGSSNQANSAEI